MADNVGIQTGVGATVATDEVSTVQHQLVKLEYGTDGVATMVSDSNPLPIDDAGGSITIDNAQLSVVGGGTEAAAMRVTIANDSTGVLSVDDNGGSITVDNAQLSVVGGGTEAAALRVTIANNSTGVLSVDDNGSTLSVDDGAGSLTTDSLAEGATGDAAVTTDTTGTISGKLRGLVKWAYERMPASLGQKTMANSFPVVVASDQSAIPVVTSSSYLNFSKVSGVTVGSSAIAYTNDDLIGSKITLTNLFTAAKVGYIESITIQIGTYTTLAGVDVLIFDADPTATTFSDNATFAINSADVAKVIASYSIPSTSFIATADAAFATISPHTLVGGTTSTLYMALVAAGGLDTTASNLISVTIGVSQS